MLRPGSRHNKILHGKSSSGEGYDLIYIIYIQTPFCQSFTNQQAFYEYSQIATALANDSKSAADQTAVNNLPASDPTRDANFVMANAEAKALSLLAATATGVDGYIGFRSTAPFTFDPNNRAVAGEYDFIGLAEHEISEIMGRYGLGQNGASSGRYSPLDLFRYTLPGVPDLVPENGDYFSIDGGRTAIGVQGLSARTSTRCW